MLEVRGLKQLSVTVVAAGVAVEEAGTAVSRLDGVPLVGEDAGRVGDRARTAGDSAQQSGATSRESVENLSVLLGLVVALVPTLPLLALWLPRRVRRMRDVRAVRKALATRGEEPAFRELLALRALGQMPYERLLAAESGPPRLGDADAARLAHAELVRLGLAQGRRP